MQASMIPAVFRTIILRWTMACALGILLGCEAGGKPQAAGADKKLDHPASVEEAAQVLDLSTFPRLKDAKPSQCCRIASLSYEAACDVKTAFEFQQKQLAEQGWTELPNSVITDQAASATFARNGFTVSATVSPMGKPGAVLVVLANHGNVELAKLPVPADAKPLYDFPAAAAYVTEASVEKTAEAICKLLSDQGWQAYGTAGDARYFKQNGVRLLVLIAAAPAQAGKTAITYSSEQLSADLPAPENAQDLRYVDLTKQLLFDAPDSQDKIVAFYRDTLSKVGWKPTTEKPIEIDRKHTLIFRNPTHDMLTLEMSPADKGMRVKLVHQSADELAALEREFQERKKKE